jgi:aerobic-type carbon monoxide dehydrogenase small subunit (CoxS/CutS family)
MNEVFIEVGVNGANVAASVEPRLTIAEFVRDRLGLQGTKLSCELQVCGACTVLVDGNPVSACTALAVDLDGTALTTIEGLAAADGTLDPIQQAFIDHFAMQCGFCTPGFVMMAKDLLTRNPSPTREDVIHHLEGNICRCTGYLPIIDAIMAAAEGSGS